MKRSLILPFVFLAGQLLAQVTFQLDTLPANTPPGSSIYLAGDFNGWNPGDSRYRLSKDSSGVYGITLKARPEGTVIRYKFTRGSWETVEKGASGEELENRRFVYGNHDTVQVKILNWADLAGGDGAGSTADSNVHILAKAFYMPQLGRYRRIWIYLPPDYFLTGKSYPVLYMHDGQNLFDDQTAFAGEWQVDETLNRLYAEGTTVPVVVGIDNGGARRIDELTPWANPRYGGGEGKKYARFIVETLKPYVDSLYRTLPGRQNTGIMGSSLGGLISDYMALKYQEVFGMAGLFSPSFWFSDTIWAFTRTHGASQNIRFYMVCGSDESENMVPDMLAMKDSLAAAGFGREDIFTKVVAGGQHNEKLWREAFAGAWLWLSHQQNTTGKTSLKRRGKLTLYPNPAGQSIRAVYPAQSGKDKMEVFDGFGRKIMAVDRMTSGKTVDVSRLSPGIYFMRITTAETFYVSQWAKR